MRERILLTVTVIGVIWILSVVYAEPSEPEESYAPASELVTVTLRGTSIELLPNQVTVYVENPRAEVAEAARRWGIPSDVEDANAIIHNAVYYVFKSPEGGKGEGEGLFQTGDVVYTFLAAGPFSKDDILAMTDRKGLKERPIGGEDKVVYSEQEGFYIMILEKVTKYTCSMHPEVTKEKGGQCPECGMDLIQEELYE
jgi:hypothetical protein